MFHENRKWQSCEKWGLFPDMEEQGNPPKGIVAGSLMHLLAANTLWGS